MWGSSIPFDYVYRNILRRRWTSVFTGLGMALVVFVFAAMLMLVAGLKSTLVETGQPDNLVLIRRSAETEVQSSVPRLQADIIEGLAGISTAPSGRPWVSKETVVLINLPKRQTNKPSNITIRGTSELGFTLRPQVKLVAGRLFRPGTSEIIAGRNIADRFQGAGLGETLHFAQRDWVVVGIFDAGRTAFSSEVWGDVEQMMQAFRRTEFSALLLKADRPENMLAILEQRFKNDPRLQMEAKRETQFYGDQSKALAMFISIMGTVLSIIFSLGAIIGAMITMYATVATRTAEIGTLRALGFPRRSVLWAFLSESMCMSAMGGMVGLVFAAMLQPLSISTTNFQTFAELVFGFDLTPAVIGQSLVFAILMGLVGGVLPAWRASRLPVVDALRG